jgi:hypothetical protein
MKLFNGMELKNTRKGYMISLSRKTWVDKFRKMETTFK